MSESVFRYVFQNPFEISYPLLLYYFTVCPGITGHDVCSLKVRNLDFDLDDLGLTNNPWLDGAISGVSSILSGESGLSK